MNDTDKFRKTLTAKGHLEMAKLDLDTALRHLEIAKGEGRMLRERWYAIAITELQKVIAFVGYYLKD